MTRGLLAVSLLTALALAAGPAPAVAPGCAGDPSVPADPSSSVLRWSWVESCHVERPHALTAFGTAGSLLLTGDLQAIAAGPRAGRSRAGHAYIATLRQRLWAGGELVLYAEGGTSHTLDAAVGDLSGTNGLVQPDDLYLGRLFLLQDLVSPWAGLAVGKFDLSDFFDTNAVANCEVNRFLAGSLVNDPVIPFPQPGLSAALRLAPATGLYLLGAVGDAAATATRSDLAAVLAGRGRPFGIVEAGLSPSPTGASGTYRLILWRRPSGAGAAGDRASARGWALSLDQAATDRLTFFFRRGVAGRPVGGASGFWSFGAALAGLPGREHDVLEAGLGLLDADRRDETLVEVDYAGRVSRDLVLTPLLQIVIDPAGRRARGTFLLPALRAVWVF